MRVDPSNLAGGATTHRWGDPFNDGEQDATVFWIREYQSNGADRLEFIFGLPPVQGNAIGAKASWRCGTGGERFAEVVAAVCAPEVAAGKHFDLVSAAVRGRTVRLRVGRRVHEGTWYPEIASVSASSGGAPAARPAPTAPAPIADDDLPF
jgi:hypothetical protein